MLFDELINLFNLRFTREIVRLQIVYNLSLKLGITYKSGNALGTTLVVEGDNDCRSSHH